MKLIAIEDSIHVLCKTSNLCNRNTSDLYILDNLLSTLPQRHTKHGQQSIAQAGRGLYRVRQRLSNTYVILDGQS